MKKTTMSSQEVTMENHLRDISEKVEKDYKEVGQIGILSGLSGIAIFQFHYADYLNTSVNSAIGAEIITKCIERINEGYQEPSYCEGLSGFGWTIQYLSNNDFIEVDCDELLSPLDFYLNDCMQNDIKNQNFDFLYGALGHAYYFFARYLSTDKIELKKRYHQYISNFISALVESAKSNVVGLAWESKLNLNTGSVGYNFGFAHGIPSIISFLSSVLSSKEFDLPLNDLIRRSIQFMLNYKRSFESKGFSWFPDFFEKGGEPLYHSRLAWCYGDLGIGFAFLKAGKVLSDTTIIRNALDILQTTSYRKKYEETLVVDGELCHGSFGIAKIYEQADYLNRQPIFREAYHFWIQNGLERATEYEGLHTYESWNPVNKKWERPITLLEGISGIGLTLIDRLNDKPNLWHKCLLIG